MQTLSVWKSLKFSMWERVKSQIILSVDKKKKLTLYQITNFETRPN